MLAAAFGFCSLIILAADLALSARAAQAASRCSARARMQLIALTGSTLAAAFCFCSLIISAAALALAALAGLTLAAAFGFSSLLIS
eukprot:jgi/Chrpa1/23945/Chrysochromulina_OHIO_Genome00022864-RA